MYEIISRKKQTHWRWPAALNFFLGSMGAGLYIMLFFFGRHITWEEGIISAHFLKLISTVLVAAGLLSVATEAGRPLRGLYLFANIRHSWISREVMFAGIFILLSLSELITNSLALSFFAAFAAVLFVISQAMILYSSSAVPAWNRPIIPLFFISSAMLNGFGLFLLLCILNLVFVNTLYPLKTTMLVYGLICIGSTQAMWVWMTYAGRPVRPNLLLIGEIGIGALLPFVGLTGLIFQSNSPKGFMVSSVYAICSISILFCGYYRLWRLVLNSDYLRPVSVWSDKPDRCKAG